MRKENILKHGRDGKVLVKWTSKDKFPNGTYEEYSVHTISYNNNLIWGHYFNTLESAQDYFSQYE